LRIFLAAKNAEISKKRDIRDLRDIKERDKKE